MSRSVTLVEAGQTIPLAVNERGEKDYEILARVGHAEGRLVQASFSDLLPKHLTDADAAVLLQKPSEEEITRQTLETQAAFDRILAKNSQTSSLSLSGGPTVVKFTPQGSSESKIVKIVEAQKDPFDPPKFSHKRAPKPPPSPPAPVLHSPPRKVSAQEQKNWAIPPCVSNWKNAKGYTIALDKRLAADGRGLRENQINEGFASFAESLYLAESHARDEVEKRATIEKKLAEKERLDKEETLRALASKAREEKSFISREISHKRQQEQQGDKRHEQQQQQQEEEHEDYHQNKFGSIKVHGASANLSIQEREKLRHEMAKEADREFRLSRMSQEQRAKYLERMENRDISEKIALGTVSASATKSAKSEGLFDQRLFDQTAGIGQGLADDEAYNVYDKPLFAAATAAHLIYRPRATEADSTDFEDGQQQLDPSNPTRKVASKAFQGADDTSSIARSGPVEFERDETTESDPFGLDSFLSEAKKRTQQDQNSTTNHSKHARRE
jgi:SNW domain-containing protein 1